MQELVVFVASEAGGGQAPGEVDAVRSQGQQQAVGCCGGLCCPGGQEVRCGVCALQGQLWQVF